MKPVSLLCVLLFAMAAAADTVGVDATATATVHHCQNYIVDGVIDLAACDADPTTVDGYVPPLVDNSNPVILDTTDPVGLDPNGQPISYPVFATAVVRTPEPNMALPLGLVLCAFVLYRGLTYRL